VPRQPGIIGRRLLRFAIVRHVGTFSIGARVKIRRDPEYPHGPWPDEPIGTVAEHPFATENRTWRGVSTPRGTRRFYWIVFDSPHLDAEGDGPYQESEILDKYIAPLVD
jgi:hypothetical protein